MTPKIYGAVLLIVFGGLGGYVLASNPFKPPIDKRRHRSCVMSNRLPQLVIGQIYGLHRVPQRTLRHSVPAPMIVRGSS
jgi:hypothetical protein